MLAGRRGGHGAARARLLRALARGAARAAAIRASLTLGALTASARAVAAVRVIRGRAWPTLRLLEELAQALVRTLVRIRIRLSEAVADSGRWQEILNGRGPGSLVRGLHLISPRGVGRVGAVLRPRSVVRAGAPRCIARAQTGRAGGVG